ncbi:hypothetical protein [Solirhodobacter olei]|jgi:hypothetical protein|uniref:hypothetical protein n=1 Tax=Solirhodobacter olei TaxID=2493082 RepID=UPI000FD8C364|nr:hypothetical protein [Solirhodobacter olei]
MTGKLIGPLAAALVCVSFSAGADGAPLLAASASPGIARLSTSNARSSERQFKAYITGYSYWDNTPPGSAEIARPVIHRRAGGTGTYTDPVTIAVGHSIIGGQQKLDFPAGTRFYLTRLEKYAVVEDVCGDGPDPQDGPCHTGYKGHPWLDVYVGGRRQSAVAADACVHRITALQTIIINPRPNYRVRQGAIADAGCRVF